MNGLTASAGNTGQLDLAVVIPTHDRPVEVVRALQSVLAQTQLPSEVFVIDDLSSSATRAAVDALMPTQVPINYVPAVGSETPGVSYSRNLGARLATASTVAFLDDDDEWEQGYCAAAVQALRVSGADFVLCHTRLRIGESSAPHMLPVEGLDWRAGLGPNPGIVGSNLVISRDCLMAIGGFDTALWVAEDQDLFVRARRAGFGYAVVADGFVIQHASGGGHLSSPSRRHAAGVLAFTRKYAEDLTREDRRFLRAWYHRASVHQSAPLHLKVYHRISHALRVSPKQWWQAVARRAGKRPATYRD